MDTWRRKWYEVKESIAEQVRVMYLKKYNKIIISGRCYTKDNKDYNIMDIVGMAQNIADESKKESEKPNKYSPKGEPDYIRDLPPWMIDDPKGGVGNVTKEGI